MECRLKRFECCNFSILRFFKVLYDESIRYYYFERSVCDYSLIYYETKASDLTYLNMQNWK